MLNALQMLLFYVLPFLFVLTLIVTVHEMGHFLAARAFGTVIDSFSLGFGRSIVEWRDKQGVNWRIGWIPLGGYVRFAGDENEASVPDQEDLAEMKAKILAHNDPSALTKFYHFKPVWQRAVIAVAGPAANFALAIVLFTFLLGVLGEAVALPKVGAVTPGSAAERAGFRAGDVVRTMDGQPVASFNDLANYVMFRGGIPIDFEVGRGDARVALKATPELVKVEDRIGGRQEIGRLGMAASGEMQRIHYGPVQALGGGFERTWKTLDTTLFYLGRVITGQVSPSQLGGFFGIAKASGEVARVSAESAPDVPTKALTILVNLLSISAALSVGIGFLNLLPIPVLDGGHLVFYAYEAVANRPLPAEVQAVGYRLGLALLLGFMLFAFWNDLQRYNVFNFLGGLFS